MIKPNAFDPILNDENSFVDLDQHLRWSSSSLVVVVVVVLLLMVVLLFYSEDLILVLIYPILIPKFLC